MEGTHKQYMTTKEEKIPQHLLQHAVQVLLLQSCLCLLSLESGSFQFVQLHQVLASLVLRSCPQVSRTQTIITKCSHSTHTDGHAQLHIAIGPCFIEELGLE